LETTALQRYKVFSVMFLKELLMGLEEFSKRANRLEG
jgi:hypothetical protein